jgi:aquaporin TIP
MNQTLFKQCVAEFIGTFALIFIGVGAIHNNTPTMGMGLLGVALALGLTIAVMVTSVGGISGGQRNPAVTFGLLVGGQISFGKATAHIVSQLFGASMAGFTVPGLLGNATISGAKIVAQGTPDLAAGVGFGQGIAIEVILTFFLVFVAYGSAVDSRSARVGVVALDILFGGPFTGGSMNPARAFRPALARGHWALP